MQISFVAKAKRIRNRKDKEYYVHRLNIPAEVAKELDLGEEDYLLVKAQKAEWYHLLDWTKMQKTWTKLPSKIKSKLMASQLFPIEESERVPYSVSTNQLFEPVKQADIGAKLWTAVSLSSSWDISMCHQYKQTSNSQFSLTWTGEEEFKNPPQSSLIYYE